MPEFEGSSALAQGIVVQPKNVSFFFFNFILFYLFSRLFRRRTEFHFRDPPNVSFSDPPISGFVSGHPSTLVGADPPGVVGVFALAYISPVARTIWQSFHSIFSPFKFNIYDLKTKKRLGIKFQ